LIVTKIIGGMHAGNIVNIPASPWQQTIRSGHSPYKGANSPYNWHSLWPLTRHKVKPWNCWHLLAWTCLHPWPIVCSSVTSYACEWRFCFLPKW
jgi:hypothetical protein